MGTLDVRTNILWSGENSNMLLKQSPDMVESTAVGFFRVDYCPAGTGHAVFVMSDMKGDPSTNGKIFACYADRREVAQWIRDFTIIGVLPEFKNHDLGRIPIKSGRFACLGNTLSSWTEVVSTDDGEIRLTWSQLLPPLDLNWRPEQGDALPYRISTLIYPAQHAEAVINGEVAPGQAFPDKIGDQVHSTAFLALSETWFT